MPQKIRIWEVTEQDTLSELEASKISLEKRLEDWLEDDISVLDGNLIVIGRQVRTDFGGEIDLLCLDGAGDTVIIELKKGMSPREVTAQALDYASWVKDLGFERINDIASNYPNLNGSLEEAFAARFNADLPSELNLKHRLLIVAETMDAATERIVRYLSDLAVPINVATVQHFKDSDGREILAQVYLVEPELAAAKVAASSIKRTYALMSEILASANDNNVGDLYRHLVDKASGLLAMFANARNLGFRPPHGSYNYRTLFDVNPRESSAINGLKFRLNGTRLANHFGLDIERVRELLPANIEQLPPSGWRNARPEELEDWNGFQGYFLTVEEIDNFIDGLRAIVD